MRFLNYLKDKIVSIIIYITTICVCTFIGFTFKLF